MFNAILLTKDNPDATPQAKLTALETGALPQTGDRDVLVSVDYSTINFKDGLAITGGTPAGRAPVVRSYPMVPGIDFSGTVLESDHPDFSPGQGVILNGWGVGEGHWGGLAQRARVKGDWLIHRPAALTSRQAMSIGTAGYTAMLCVQALQRHGLSPSDGEVLVTGAAGGVGSVAIALLADLGFRVVASTGRLAETDYLTTLGASEVMDRALFSAPGKPLQKERWAAVVDSVGSHTLANACAATRSGGAVAACGLAQGLDFPATVAPFILRGVCLYGINSVTISREKRESAWNQLVKDLNLQKLDAMTTEIALEQAIEAAPRILAGDIRGRLVVDVNR
ncbi:MAG: MDR family oxidoreductase [Burkholderiaceae bacterium]